jgi:hypothetical protein
MRRRIFQGFVVDLPNPVVLVVTDDGVVNAGGFGEGEVVDALKGSGDLGGDLVIFGDQGGDTMTNEGGMGLGLGSPFGPKLGRATRGAVGDGPRIWTMSV